MNEIGENFRDARLSSSISLEETSADTNIPVEALEQIEEGSIGSFKDIFKLREYLQTYAKYLGLDAGKVIDNFNEYMFEYTSKIPLDDLAEKMVEQAKEKMSQETNEVKVVSPYLNPKEESKVPKYVFTAIIIILLVAIALIWAIKQVA